MTLKRAGLLVMRGLYIGLERIIYRPIFNFIGRDQNDSSKTIIKRQKSVWSINQNKQRLFKCDDTESEIKAEQFDNLI